MKRSFFSSMGFYTLVGLVVFYMVFPFYYAMLSSLKSGSHLFEVDYLPRHWEWGNYVAVFQEQPFGTNIFNSVLVAVAVVTLSLL